jgi:hypothetical protein
MFFMRFQVLVIILFFAYYYEKSYQSPSFFSHMFYFYNIGRCNLSKTFSPVNTMCDEPNEEKNMCVFLSQWIEI